MREEVPVICPTPQAKGLRQIGTTGKSGGGSERLSSDEQLLGTAVIAEEPTGCANERPMTGSATKRSRIFLRRDWIASLALAMPLCDSSHHPSGASGRTRQ